MIQSKSYSPTRIFSLRDVLERNGRSRSTLYAYIAKGLWTHPVKLGPRIAGWPDSEVYALNAARIAGKSEPEIRSLVRDLEAARTKL